jgi:hypothetical protein
MIEKDKGRPNINRLRIIHLFEADLNLFLKIQWGKRLIRHAKKYNIIHPGQHGSVPGCTTMDPIMLTQVTNDLCRTLKCNLARFDNDASACYDRIIVALAMLAARRCGMPANAIRSHAETLQFMKDIQVNFVLTRHSCGRSIARVGTPDPHGPATRSLDLAGDYGVTVVVGSESYVSGGLPVTKYDMIVRGRLTLLGRWSWYPPFRGGKLVLESLRASGPRSMS